jgi:membrane protein DedA with SNARE-associated domain
MPLLRFGLLTAAGSLIWNTIFVLSGFLLGESWHVVEQYVDVVQWVVIAVVAMAVAWFLFVRTRTLIAASRDGSSDADEPERERVRAG